jgi:hypothetical protein
VRNENEKYFAQWRALYFGDGERAIAQVPPERPRGLLTRISERLARDRHEKSLPPYRRKGNLRHFYDGLDAASLLEGAIGEFGYSFRDLQKAPNLIQAGLPAGLRDAANANDVRATKI